MPQGCVNQMSTWRFPSFWFGRNFHSQIFKIPWQAKLFSTSLHGDSVYRMSYKNGHFQRRLLILLLLAAFFTNTSVGRKFRSRDADVQLIIAPCEQDIQLETLTAKIPCQATLGCILRRVGAYTTARWSGGASILAFIPTITGVMSNSIAEVVQIVEEDTVLAVMLGLSSVTVFASWFGSGREQYPRTAESILEYVTTRIERTVESSKTEGLKALKKRRFALCLACGVLLAACFAVWFPATVILRNGVVVFSCPQQIHIPIWIGLGQILVVVHVLLRRFCFERTTIRFRPLQRATQSGQTPASIMESFEHFIILRSPKHGIVSRSLHGITSVLTFALYAFATAVLGATTMFTASDAVWCMVLFAFAAGMGRIVANFAIEDYIRCRRTIVVDVPQKQLDAVKKKGEGVVTSIATV